MERPPSIGPKHTDLELIQATFELRGEDVIRRTTGKVVTPPKRKPAVVFVKWASGGGQRNMLYHRIKYALMHGHIPPDDVDHRDRDGGNHSGTNLRKATRSQNLCNRVVPRDLPRGVYRHTAGRFYAKVKVPLGPQKYLGLFDTAEEASARVEEFLKPLHGEFYREPN